MSFYPTILHKSIVIAMLLIANMSNAQDKRFMSLTTADGLPQNSVEAFAQDSLGFLWIGTQDGLVKYDGYEMQVFRNDPKDSNSLSDNFITKLHIDDHQNLWVGTRNGVNLYRPSTNTFLRYLPYQNRLHQAVTSIQSHNSKVLVDLIGLHAGFIVNDSTKSLSPFRLDTLGNDSIFCIRTIGKDSIVVKSSQLEIYRAGKRILIEMPDQIRQLRAYHSSIFEDQNAYFIQQKGIWRIDKNTLEIERIYLGEIESEIRYLNDVTSIGNELWVSSDQGLFVLDKTDWSKEHYRHHPSDPFSINYDFVHGVFQDQSGVVWVGTANKGLNYFNPEWEWMNYIHPSSQVSMPHPLVWNITEKSPNDLWISTAAGIARFDVSNSIPIPLEIPKRLQEVTAVRDLMFDGESTLWIATTSQGLLKYDLLKESITNYSAKYHLSTECVDLALDTFGKLWIGSYNGFYLLDKEDYLQRINDSLQSNYTMDVNIIGDSVFISHSGGVVVRSVSHPFEQPRVLVADVTDSLQLPFSITSAVAFAQGKYWVGMYDRGIARVGKNLKVEKLYAEDQGLSGHVIESILVDEKERVWVATNQGLSMIDPKTDEVLSWKKKNGLRSGEFALGSAFISENGRLFFGSVEGMVYFKPDELMASNDLKTPLPSLSLSALKVNYEDYHESSASFNNLPLASLKTIELFPDQRVVSFHFSALQLTNQEGISYEFKLDGFDQKPVKVSGDQRVATYSNLPTGTFEFNVSASFSNGKPAALPFKIKVIVHPPFYEQTWFVFSVFLLIMLVVAAAVRYYSFVKYRQKLREVKTRERIQSERARISRDLHDSVGSQLTYMIGSLDNLAFVNDRKGQDSEEINELSDFARGTMQQLREAIWVINKDTITVEEFKLKLEDHCAKVLNNEFAPEVRLELSGNVSKTMEATKTLHLFRICQEALNNVVKHAQASEVRLVIRSEEDSLLITISDNGVGFDVGKRKDGHYGLVNINERVHEMGGKISWESQAGIGTQITIEVRN